MYGIRDFIYAYTDKELGDLTSYRMILCTPGDSIGYVEHNAPLSSESTPLVVTDKLYDPFKIYELYLRVYNMDEYQNSAYKNKKISASFGTGIDYSVAPDYSTTEPTETTTIDSTESTETTIIDITKPTETTTVENITLLGDANNDNKIDSNDAVVVLQTYASDILFPKKSENKNMDVNNDNKVDSKDAVIILQYYAYKISGSSEITMEDFIKISNSNQ